jgi:hypothetical protein
LTLPEIYQVAYGPGAVGLELINTPWPFIVGQAVFSIVVYWIGDKPPLKWKLFWWKAQYAINMVRSLGGMAWLIFDIVHGGTFPSVGAVLMLSGFLVGAYPPEPEWFKPALRETPRRYTELCRMAHITVLAGYILYLVTGALQLKNHEFNDASVAIGVGIGCPNGTFDPSFSDGPFCSHPAPYTIRS